MSNLVWKRDFSGLWLWHVGAPLVGSTTPKVGRARTDLSLGCQPSPGPHKVNLTRLTAALLWLLSTFQFAFDNCFKLILPSLPIRSGRRGDVLHSWICPKSFSEPWTAQGLFCLQVQYRYVLFFLQYAPGHNRVCLPPHSASQEIRRWMVHVVSQEWSWHRVVHCEVGYLR